MLRYVFLLLCIWPTLVVVAQDPFSGQPVVMGPDGKPIVVGAPPSRPPGKGKPGEAPAEGEKKPEGDAKADEKADAPPKVIRRDELEKVPANADELRKAVLGEDGKVSFEFRNQTWPELVQWLSDLSAEPIDWQELPGDRVNVTTPGRYTVAEVSDLLNRHLLGRGYTILKLDGGLTIVKCDAINPSLVPRFEEDGLTNLPPHMFARVSLDVGWLSAEKLATELKPMISRNGTLTALTTTNRIEAMDSAITLRQVAELLAQERSAASREALAPEFKLRHLPAEEAKKMLEQFLGIEKQKEAPMTPQQIQMMQQQMRNNGGEQPAPPPKKPDISVVANNRQNSIIIMAPADRIAIATEFLKRVDVPSATIQSLADIQNRVQVFRLASLDPEKLIEIIQEMNILEPTTRTRVDNENRAVIVSGSAADRYIIDQLIKRLDGSGRKFEVLQLRRLEAGEVAESIGFLMGQEKEKEDSSRNRYSSYFYGFGGDDKEKKKEDKFRVAANTRFRQVLLWANELEMAEVRNLLVKLGELPPPGGDSRTIRMIDASPTRETLEYLRQLQQQWGRIGPNAIELPAEDEFVDPHDDIESEDQEAAPEGDTKEVPSDPKRAAEELDTVANDDVAIDAVYLAMMQMPAEAHALPLEELPAEELPSDKFPMIESAEQFDRAFNPPPKPEPSTKKPRSAAPIRIEMDRAGNLMLSSSDTEALDRLESLMLQFTPPKRPYRVFKVRHASATWMSLNLEDYFKDNDEKKESDADSFFRYYWGGGDDDKKKEPTGLGKGVKLRFVSDIDTNTIVVSGADAEQLQTIGELIELWDVPEPVNKRKTRFTRLVRVEFGKAESVANTVKDAYRDLLSSNDKAFQEERAAQQGGNSVKSKTPRSRDSGGSALQDTAGNQESGGSDVTFKGKLSVGVDTIGNTLLISAEGEPLLELVCDMIDQLDQASRPSGDVQVVQLSGGVSPDALEAALKAFGAGNAKPPRDAADNRGRNRDTPDPEFGLP